MKDKIISLCAEIDIHIYESGNIKMTNEFDNELIYIKLNSLPKLIAVLQEIMEDRKSGN